MALLDDFQDPLLEVELKWGPEELAKREATRLSSTCSIIYITSQIPRRLSDATREELALDKRRARRVLHVVRQCLVAWGGTEHTPTEDERSAGAQLAWELWAEDHERVVGERLRYAATWAKRTGHLRFGKSAVVKLNQELEWMIYALRD